MSYANLVAWLSGKQHVWLYRIERGGSTKLMTTLPGGYTNADGDWEHTPDLTHTGLNQTQTINQANVSLTFSNSNTYARQFLDPLGIIYNSVEILHGFSNDPDDEFVTKFRGRIVGTRPTRETITLVVEDHLTALRRNGLGTVLQRPCSKALYGTKCGVNIADYETAGTVTAMNGEQVTVTEAAGQANGYYKNGIITFAGSRQMILGHSGSTLTLIAPLPGLENQLATGGGTASVQIAPGCTLSASVCQSRFGNIRRFGGWDKMNNGTPFDGRSIF